jgi:hypothetical protein
MTNSVPIFFFPTIPPSLHFSPPLWWSLVCPGASNGRGVRLPAVRGGAVRVTGGMDKTRTKDVVETSGHIGI